MGVPLKVEGIPRIVESSGLGRRGDARARYICIRGQKSFVSPCLRRTSLQKDTKDTLDLAAERLTLMSRALTGVVCVPSMAPCASRTLKELLPMDVSGTIATITKIVNREKKLELPRESGRKWNSSGDTDTIYGST